jgi:hypothetical protein
VQRWSHGRPPICLRFRVTVVAPLWIGTPSGKNYLT